ncbi:penicillin-binding protein 1C [Candidatus Avelusimicrobium gallicola]|uniref:peptidoglycan glycosyltransferase n=1 Tax=Candidatus Avelusimicrobium gallicola TaxID=2562704 RepID=A0A1Y4DBD6_9BACT|nr:penicillin-binding protein 1C [Elusimicrobium sp. An273]OUO56467.1 penicillin-binding protein 1C [Elusimicrobium sp. An273]
MRCIWKVFFLLLLPCLVWGEEAFLSPSKQIYDRYGAPMRGFLSENNTYYLPVPLTEISPWLIAAALAAEDKRFFSHPGVDVKAILRAAWQNATEGEIVSGASTITQQLARALEPRPRTLWGKAKEAYNALLLEREMTKEEILEEYFNLLELGNLTQGAEAASRFYFNVSASELSLSQAAFLAGLIKSPTYYNPLKHFSRAIKRRDWVLKRMLENEFIDEEMYQMAVAEKLELKSASRPFDAPHFTRFLYPLLPPQTQDVYATIDRDLQLYAEELVKNYISQLKEDNVTNAAVVVVENATGGVLAYVGSADFYDQAHNGQVDGARALRQPGSALKPFVYGLTFEQGLLTPASLLDDKDTFFEGGFRPRNYDESYHGFVPVRTALACSYNIPAVRAAEKTGASNILALLRRAGLTSLEKPADFYGLGIALGNGEVRLLDLTNAYAALARGGVYKPLRVGQRPAIYLPGRETRIFDEQTAYLVTDILADNNARAPAFGLNSALSVPFALAAKTGTSKDYKDNFTLAYTPRWTIGVWVGNFDATPMQKVSGVTGAGPIMHDLAVYLQKKYPSEPFETPAGITRALVCTQSGLLAGPACTHTKEEVFSSRHLPAVCSGRHQVAVSALAITSPDKGDVFKMDPSIPRAAQVLRLEAACAEKSCRWTMDGEKLPGISCQTWWPLKPGKHTLKVSCASEEASADFEVLP